MKKTILLILPFVLLLFVNSFLYGKKIQLFNLKSTVNIFYAKDFQYAPGDTFCLQGGVTSGGLRLYDFKGEEGKPLVFINSGGRAEIEDPTYVGIDFRNCHFIHLTGTGDPSIEYGIYVKKSKAGTVGVSVGSLSSDFEIDNIEVGNTGFAGIMAKTDQNCNDTLTWRRNGYVLKNLHIHHNYIHDTHGEGMYIGNTSGYKYVSKITCGDAGYVFAHWLEHVDIHHNLVENSGWDGIQVGLVREDCKIYQNQVINYGLEGEVFQNFGMSVGGGNIQLYNNHIQNDLQYTIKGSIGVQSLNATSGSYFYGNVIINTGSYGMFVHNRSPFDENLGYYFLNNTIINTGLAPDDPRSAIMYNSCITASDNAEDIGKCQEEVRSHFYNNLLVNPGIDYESMSFWKKEQESFLDFNTKELRDSAYMSHNVMSRQMDTLDLVDVDNHDYRISDMRSVLYNSGKDVSTIQLINVDIDGVARPQQGKYDIGAYEFVPSVLNVLPEGNIIQNIYPTSLSSFYLDSRLSIATVFDLSGKQLGVLTHCNERINLFAGVYLIKGVLVEGGMYSQKIVINE